jgi:hypothetical protein
MSGKRTNLEVSKLGEWLAAVVQFADVRFSVIVNDLVGADVAALRESLPTDGTRKRSLARVASLVGLERSQSRGAEEFGDEVHSP